MALDESTGVVMRSDASTPAEALLQGLGGGSVAQLSEDQRTALRILARRLMMAGNFRHARVVYSALVKYNPGKLEFLLGAAYAFKGENCHLEALGYFQMALLFGFEDADVALDMAECFLALGFRPSVEESLRLAEQFFLKSGDARVKARIDRMRAALST